MLQGHGSVPEMPMTGFWMEMLLMWRSKLLRKSRRSDRKVSLRTSKDNRSSDNFTIGNIPTYATKLQWKIVDGPKDAKFDVMKDISFGIDETIFYDLTDGSESEIKTSEDFYIARPENTDGESFTVEVYAIP